MSKIYPIEVFKLYFDGCSKGNPGQSGIGAVIYKNDEEIWNGCEYVGHKTNNESEYLALIHGLEKALTLGISELLVYGDSLLVINQMTKKYQVKSESLYKLNMRANEIVKHFDSVDFYHVFRTENKRADKLSNDALNKSSKPYVDDSETELITADSGVSDSNKTTKSFLPYIKKAW
jgi:ribonuclease HI